MGHNCSHCLIPTVVPNVSLDSRGVCNLCHDYERADISFEEVLRAQREADLEAALENCRGKGEYDALVNLSGGKDSCLLLYKLKEEYGLNVLAFTTDMNVPECAWENIHRTVEKLGVHHVTFTPPKTFYRKLFRFLLQNQEERGAVRTVCYVCAPLFEGYSLKLATEKGIPLVLAGYSPGQPEPERMVYEFSRELLCRKDWTPPEILESGLFTQDELDLFWNPLRYPRGTQIPRYLAPFHAWEYSQSEAMKLVVELGLISNSRHASPIHSNCPVNWLLMYSDLQNLGFNPYTPEFSQLIREGKANRLYWRILGPIVNFIIRHRILMGRNVTKSLDWLGLTTSDLRITHNATTDNGTYYAQSTKAANSNSRARVEELAAVE